MHNLYTHPQFLDVAFEVLDIKQYKNSSNIVLKVLWYNIHAHKNFGYPYEPWVIDYRSQKLKIPLNKWREFTGYKR